TAPGFGEPPLSRSPSPEKFCSDPGVRTSEAAAGVNRCGIQGTLASPNQVAGPGSRRTTPDACGILRQAGSFRKPRLCHTGKFSKKELREAHAGNISYL